MNKPTRKERERQWREKQVLEAAEEIFSGKGFHKATIQEIAEKSEFAIGTIYQMFANKDEIYLKLLQMRTAEYLLILQERIDAAKDPVEKIRMFIRSKFEYFSEHKAFFRLFLNTTYGPGWDARVELENDLIEKYEQRIILLSKVFEEGIAMNFFHASDPVAMALSVDGMVNSVIGFSIRHENDEVFVPDVSAVDEIFLQSMLKARKKKTS